jgi:hypothetical protein
MPRAGFQELQRLDLPNPRVIPSARRRVFHFQWHGAQRQPSAAAGSGSGADTVGSQLQGVVRLLSAYLCQLHVS